MSSFLHFEGRTLMRIEVTRTQWDTSDVTDRLKLGLSPFQDGEDETHFA